ncbi:MAG: glycyl-radical enzyme activating protein [Candidatus Latescibacteria bacterium]|nr:glycyl-radical enzyme activating protein [Candidatus Latescibacterota bacterium]
MTGIVFNIQRFSIHDGPGIRTTIFLKGCSLHCFWCHNPEGIRLRPEIQFFPSRCINCGVCLDACQHGARIEHEGGMIYLREKCVACGACVETCYAGATVRVGKEMVVEQVVDEVLQDRAFYQTSGGGVTLSGGEPAIQRAFSQAILACCKAEGLHTAIETAGNCRWEDLIALLPVTDLVMMDIKHLNPGKHRAATGVSNERILAHARRLVQTDKPIIFRVPVVPTVNDTAEEITTIADFVRRLADLRSENGHGVSLLSLELLPFHRLAGDKYRSLGMDYHAGQLDPPTKEKMAELVEVVRARGVAVQGR